MTQPDTLIDSYRAAQKLQDNAGPSELTRRRILAHAEQLANSNPSKDAVILSENTTDLIAKKASNTAAVNDSQWKIRALASVAVFGIAGLMMLQLSKEAPDEFSPKAKPPVSTERSAEPATTTATLSENESKVAANKSAPVEAPAAATAAAPAAAVTKPAASSALAPSPKSAPLREQNANKSDSARRDDAEAAVPKLTKEPRAGAMADKAAELAPALAPPQPPSAAAPAAAIAPASPASASAPAAVTESAKLSKSAAIAPRANTSAANATTSANTKLFNAIQTKDATALKLALDGGDDKNAKNASGTPALSLCVQSEQLNLVRLLIAAGADVNALDALGVSPLAHARNRGLTDIVNLLLNSGAK
jgi:hypothetical protein